MHLPPAAARHAVVRTPDGGWLLQPLDGQGSPLDDVEQVGDARALAVAVARIESATAPRWVWRAASATYRGLAGDGVRVGRCHDLDHTERLLLGQEARWVELSAAAPTHPDAERPDGEPDLFSHGAATEAAPNPVAGPDAGSDPARQLAELVADHADQLTRIGRVTDRLPGFGVLVAAESAGALLGVEMGLAGLPWDVVEHDRLLTELLGPRPALPAGQNPAAVRPKRLLELAVELAACLDDPRVNPDSPADLLRSLRRAGLPVGSTGRHELARHDHPAVPLVRRYKELARLWTAHGWAWQDAWVSGGRFRPEYLPAGVISGRWAARGGGALQIPRAVRGAVRVGPDRMLVVADAGQLEPRVLAALSADPGMIAATRAGDLYTDIASRALGRADARGEAKLALLSAMYGGGSGSPALAALTRRFPAALALLESAARAGEDGGSVVSVLGRVCPPAEPGWLDGLPDAAAAARTRSRGRFTRNFVVQASAADWASAWLAALRRRLAEHEVSRLVFFQHDEVIVETSPVETEAVVAAVTEAGAEATRLVLGSSGVEIPLVARPVASYADK